MAMLGLVLGASLSVIAQGVVTFGNTRSLVGGEGAPVYAPGGVGAMLSGTNWVAQLYGGPNIHRLEPVGSPMPFRTGAGAGYFQSAIVAIPTVAP